MNRLSEFNEGAFTIYAYCNGCRHSASVRRPDLDPQITTTELTRRLRCRMCDGTNCSIQIVYTAAGGFAYRSD